MSMTPFSDEFMDAKVNNIYHGDPSQGAAGVFVNLTMKVNSIVFRDENNIIENASFIVGRKCSNSSIQSAR